MASWDYKSKTFATIVLPSYKRVSLVEPHLVHELERHLANLGPVFESILLRQSGHDDVAVTNNLELNCSLSVNTI